MSTSQTKLRALGLVVLSAALAVPMIAQQDAPPPPPPADAQGPPPNGPHGGRGMMDPRHRLEMMTHELNLSPEQQTAIKAVFMEQREKMKAEHDQQQQPTPEARRAAREEEKAKIEAILTPDQKTKFEAMEAKMREQMRERRNGDNPPPPPPQ